MTHVIQNLKSTTKKIYSIFPARGGGGLDCIEKFCDEVNIPKNWRKIICYAISTGKFIFTRVAFCKIRFPKNVSIKDLYIHELDINKNCQIYCTARISWTVTSFFRCELENVLSVQ